MRVMSMWDDVGEKSAPAGLCAAPVVWAEQGRRPQPGAPLSRAQPCAWAPLALGRLELVRNHAAQEGEPRGHLAASLGVGLQPSQRVKSMVGYIATNATPCGVWHHCQQTGWQMLVAPERLPVGQRGRQRRGPAPHPHPTPRTTVRSSFATAAATLALQSAASTRSNVPKGRAMDAGAWTLRHGARE